MPLSMTLGSLRDPDGGRVVPDPHDALTRLCKTAQTDAAAFPLLSSIDEAETKVFNWLQVRPLHIELREAAQLAGLQTEAKPLLDELGEFRAVAIDMIWFVSVTGS